jgi:uncharacterized protein involved in exopolysaccharide biosynthesis
MDTSKQSLGEEINLREMILILWRHKWLIIGVTLLALLVAGIVGFLSINPQYQSKATIQVDRLNLIIALSTISKPGEDVSILLENTPERDITNEDILALLENIPQMDFLESLARDEKLLAEVNQSFEKRVYPTSSSIEDRVVLIVTASDPEIASEYVNLWSKKYVDRLNNEYPSDRMIGYIDAYIEALWAKVMVAEKSLLNILSDEKVEIKEAEHAHAKQSLTNRLAEIEDNEDLLEEIQAFDHNLAEQDADVNLTSSQRIRSTSLHQRAYSDYAETMTDRSTIDYFSDDYTVAQARNDLRILVTAIEDEIDLLESDVVQLGSHVQALSVELNAIQTEAEIYRRQREFAIEDYLTWQPQLLESKQMLLDQEWQFARIVSQGQKPSAPLQDTKLLINTLSAGVAGFTLTIFFILLFEWWQTPVEEAKYKESGS